MTPARAPALPPLWWHGPIEQLRAVLAAERAWALGTHPDRAGAMPDPYSQSQPILTQRPDAPGFAVAILPSERALCDPLRPQFHEHTQPIEPIRQLGITFTQRCRACLALKGTAAPPPLFPQPGPQGPHMAISYMSTPDTPTYTPPPVTGYRTLSQTEVDLMNRIKAKGTELQQLVQDIGAHIRSQPTKPSHVRTPDGSELQRMQHTEPMRWLAIGTTDLQQGLMAITRAVAQPTTF